MRIMDSPITSARDPIKIVAHRNTSDTLRDWRPLSLDVESVMRGTPVKPVGSPRLPCRDAVIDAGKQLSWFKSSFSDSGDCVEVAFGEGAVHVRDSKSPDVAGLVFTGSEWCAFLRGVTHGEFDLPAADG